MALTPIQIIRLTVQDSTPGLYIISDDEIQYFLDKNEGNLNRTSLDCARVILMNLSMRSNCTVDVLSLSSSKVAQEYRQSLQMFLRDPSMNPVLTNCQGYAGGISVSDMQANVDNADNNYAHTPDNLSVKPVLYPSSYPSDYFRI